MKLPDIARALALAAFEIGAIKIRPENPFTWASGWKSPIYNDNRLLLGYPMYRRLVIQGLAVLIEEHVPDVHTIAGTSTAGIPWASLVANEMDLPLCYIRDKPKGHGLGNRIEGIDAEKGFLEEKVPLIEDLISTGGSSVDAVQAIRDANGIVDHCFAIYSYGFPKAAAMFAGEVPYDKEQTKKLSISCNFTSILQYPLLLEIGIERRYIKKEHRVLLEQWSADPEGWSKRYKEARVE